MEGRNSVKGTRLSFWDVPTQKFGCNFKQVREVRRLGEHGLGLLGKCVLYSYDLAQRELSILHSFQSNALDDKDEELRILCITPRWVVVTQLRPSSQMSLVRYLPTSEQTHVLEPDFRGHSKPTLWLHCEQTVCLAGKKSSDSGGPVYQWDFDPMSADPPEVVCNGSYHLLGRITEERFAVTTHDHRNELQVWSRSRKRELYKVPLGSPPLGVKTLTHVWPERELATLCVIRCADRCLLRPAGNLKGNDYHVLRHPGIDSIDTAPGKLLARSNGQVFHFELTNPVEYNSEGWRPFCVTIPWGRVGSSWLLEDGLVAIWGRVGMEEKESIRLHKIGRGGHPACDEDLPDLIFNAFYDEGESRCRLTARRRGKGSGPIWLDSFLDGLGFTNYSDVTNRLLHLYGGQTWPNRMAGQKQVLNLLFHLYPVETHLGLFRRILLSNNGKELVPSMVQLLFDNSQAMEHVKMAYSLGSALFKTLPRHSPESEAIKKIIRWGLYHGAGPGFVVNEAIQTDFDLMVDSAYRQRILSQRERTFLHHLAAKTVVFEDPRYLNVLEQLSRLRNEVETVKMNLKAVHDDVQRLKKALASKAKREAALGVINCVVSIFGGTIVDALSKLADLSSIPELVGSLIQAPVEYAEQIFQKAHVEEIASNARDELTDKLKEMLQDKAKESVGLTEGELMDLWIEGEVMLRPTKEK